MASIVSYGHFQSGESVSLVPRGGDSYGGGKAEAKANVDKRGWLSFDGLQAGAPYWLVADDDVISVTAKDRTDAPHLSPSVDPVSQTEGAEVVKGPRNTTHVKPKKRTETKPATIQHTNPEPEKQPREPARKTSRASTAVKARDERALARTSTARPVPKVREESGRSTAQPKSKRRTGEAATQRKDRKA